MINTIKLNKSDVVKVLKGTELKTQLPKLTLIFNKAKAEVAKKLAEGLKRLAEYDGVEGKAVSVKETDVVKLYVYPELLIDFGLIYFTEGGAVIDDEEVEAEFGKMIKYIDNVLSQKEEVSGK